VLGLDYGTTFTAVAFGFDHETFQDIRLITNWPGGYSSEGVVPSQIAYGGQETWEAWGYDIPLREARHIWTKRLLDADRIPQELHPSSGLNQPEFEEGRPTSPMKEPKRIVQDYLSAVKNCVFCHLEMYFGETFSNLLAVDVVVTVPALWSDKAKELIYQAVRGSGFSRGGGKLMIVTEPEAAATYIIKATESEFGGNFFKVMFLFQPLSSIS